METIDYDGIALRRWRQGPSTFVARPEAGARLMHWNVRLADGSSRDVLHWPDDADFSDFAKVRGGNPILFPFAGRSAHRGQLDTWRDASGEVRPMPRHGFARESAFDLTHADERGFSAALIPSEAAREAYPFDYRFTVTYAFDELSLRVALTLENRDERPLLWSAGHHFYFKLPWHAELGRGDYRYALPARKRFEHGGDGSLLARKPAQAEGAFDDPALPDTIFTRLNGDTARFGPRGGEEDVSVRLSESSHARSIWNAFVLWTADDASPFYCVEPWMGPPNAPEHGKGLNRVEPDASATFAVEVSLM